MAQWVTTKMSGLHHLTGGKERKEKRERESKRVRDRPGASSPLLLTAYAASQTWWAVQSLHIQLASTARAISIHLPEKMAASGEHNIPNAPHSTLSAQRLTKKNNNQKHTFLTVQTHKPANVKPPWIMINLHDHITFPFDASWHLSRGYQVWIRLISGVGSDCYSWRLPFNVILVAISLVWDLHRYMKNRWVETVNGGIIMVPISCQLQ